MAFSLKDILMAVDNETRLSKNTAASASSKDSLLPKLKALTKDQINLMDKDALQAAKQTLVSTLLNQDLKNKKISKPELEDFIKYMMALDAIRTANPNITNWVLEAVVAAYVLSLNSVPKVTALSCAAYFIGTQGYICRSVGVTEDILERYARCASVSENEITLSDTDSVSRVQLVPIIKGNESASTPKEETVSTHKEKTEIKANTLPLDLVRHLASYQNTEDVALEVCRIMMLGPKSRRAEDAQDALINAWNIMQKNK